MTKRYTKIYGYFTLLLLISSSSPSMCGPWVITMGQIRFRPDVVCKATEPGISFFRVYFKSFFLALGLPY